MRPVLLALGALTLASLSVPARADDLLGAQRLVLSRPDAALLFRLAASTSSAARALPPSPPPREAKSPDPDRLAEFRTAEAGRRPEDHTPIFRVRHERAASSKDAKCAYCHAGLSGSQRDACNDCHAVMRPRSHGVRFRTTEHGRQAALDQKRCAVCHEIEYCTECHQIPPDSHYPIQNFTTHHQRLARANPRSCMTCHTFDSTCAECHFSTTAPPSAGMGSALGARRGPGR